MRIKVLRMAKLSSGGGNMNKKGLIEELSRKTNLTLSESRTAIDEFQNIVIEALKRGDNVNITNFGCFKMVERKGRLIYNPMTGNFDKYNARRTPVFRSGLKFKKEVI